MDIKSRVKVILVTLLILNSIWVVLLWPIDIASGAFPRGLFANQPEGSIPIFHLAAECIMAAITVVGLIGWIQGKRWGRGLSLLGIGMFSYSAINSMGWAFTNNPILAAPMLFTLLLAAILVPMLVCEKSAIRAPGVQESGLSPGPLG